MRKYLGLLFFIIFTVPTLGIEPQEFIDYASKASGNTSFYYENLITGEIISYNQEKTFEAASTIKLPLISYVYQLAIEGKLDLDSTLTYTSNDYRGGSGVILKDPVGTKYTIRELAEKSIVYSDNIAYYMLRAKVGSTNFKSYIRDIGGTLSDSTVFVTINTIQFASYIKAYYNLTLEYPEMGKELIDYWQNTIYVNHIEAGITDIPVGHKIGFLPLKNLFHDGGVVYHEEPYILIILNQGPSDAVQKEIFTQLSSKIHQYHDEQYQENKRMAYEEFIATKTIGLRELASILDLEIFWENELATATNKNIKLTANVSENIVILNEEKILIDLYHYNDTIRVGSEIMEILSYYKLALEKQIVQLER